ncbi:MAG: ligase-associated DNA damage response endonuclease PdeM [Flavobacteriales bacterium]|nr:ligase-associated DNA damage response endonuclease PdeM [Flavobacteriales bacterium]
MLSAEVSVAGERLLLHPHRALFWPRRGWLVVSDLHLGKATHLRKGGAALPEGSDARTLERLDEVIATFRPQRIVLLGDLFHSSLNTAWDRVADWSLRQDAPLHLVPGNHDMLADRRYAEAGIHVCDEAVKEGPFVFTHEAEEHHGSYVISGHVHPGVLLAGRGRQKLRLPCFRFGVRTGILPAFGLPTGLHCEGLRPGIRTFACTPNAVIDVSSNSTALVAPEQTRPGHGRTR